MNDPNNMLIEFARTVADANKAKKVNALNSQEKYKLNVFVEKNKETIIGLTDDAAAKLASQELGFKVSVGNLTGARKAVGIPKRGLHCNSRGKKKNKSAVNYVARALLDLYVELGKEPTEILRQIAERRRMEVSE